MARSSKNSSNLNKKPAVEKKVFFGLIPLPSRKTRIFLIILFGILLLGAIPRAIELVNHNYLFEFDQGLYFQDVKKIVVDHKITLIGAEVGRGGGFFQGPGWTYLLTIPFILSRGDPYGAMVMMFLFGILTIIFAAIVGRQIFGLRTGLVIGFLIAISPAVIAQSRFIWAPLPISLFVIFFLFCIYKILQKDQRFLPVAALLIGIIAHLEIAVAGLMLLECLILLPFLLLKKYVSIKYIFLAIGAFLLTQSTLILFDFRHNHLIAHGIYKLWTSPPESATNKMGLLTHLLINLDVFRANFFSSFQFSKYLGGLIFALLLTGSYFFLRDKKVPDAKKLFVIFILISPILLFLILAIFQSAMAEWWLIGLIINYCFLTGILLGYIGKTSVGKKVGFGILAVFFVGFALQTIRFYQTDYFDYGGRHKIKGKLEALDYIYQDARGEPFGVLVFTPPVYTYDYDYLFWWYGTKKYHYQPHNEKRGTFYLLINADSQKPWSYKGWQETVIKTGKVIKTTTLPKSGFIVEKRKA